MAVERTLSEIREKLFELQREVLSRDILIQRVADERELLVRDHRMLGTEYERHLHISWTLQRNDNTIYVPAQRPL